MDALQLLRALLVGLAGSVHCAAMCGGIVGALSGTTIIPPRRPAVSHVWAYNTARTAAYTAGRMPSVRTAGARVGGLAGGACNLAPMIGIQSAFYWLANLMLIALGL